MDLFRKTKLSIIYKIMLSFMFFMLIIISIMSVATYSVEKRNIERITRDYSLEILDDQIDAVNFWITEKKQFLDTASISSEIKSLDINTFKPYLNTLLLTADDAFGNLFIVDQEGNFTDNAGNVSNIKKDNYFQEIISGKKTIILSQPIIPTNFKQPSLIIGVPIMKDNTVIGMLGGTIFLKDLSTVLGKSTIKGTGYAMIVDQEGNMLYHPNSSYILTMNILTSYEQGFVDLGFIGNAMVKQQMGTGSFTDDQGIERFMVFKGVPGTNWSIGIASYKSKVFESIKTLIYTVTIISILAMIAGMFLSFYIAKGITVPIKNLTEIVQKFAKGDSKIRAKIESADEIGILSESFNNMATTIMRHTENLEDLIQDRTQILSDLNYQILTRNKELGNMNEKLEMTNSKLHEMATTDMLTGLYNRAEFIRVLNQSIEDAYHNNEGNFSLLFIDLDNFKYYNDTFNHEIGDFLLQEVSTILKASTRDDDMVARYGGDEFVVLLRPGFDELAMRIAERIHTRIIEKEGYRKDIMKKLNKYFELPIQNRLSCSIGIVNYSKAMAVENSDELLKLADETMYIAKKQGKSRIIVHQQ